MGKNPLASAMGSMSKYPEDHNVAFKLSNLTPKELDGLLDNVFKESVIYEFLEKVQKQNSRYGQTWIVKKFIQLLGLDKKENKEDVTAISTILEKRYPMITEIGGYVKNIETVTQYIQQMDQLATIQEKF